MIIPDVNLLLHAHDSEFQRHRAAREWWESLMNGIGSVGLPWVSILGSFASPRTRRYSTIPSTWMVLARVSGPGSFDRRRFLSTLEFVMRTFCSISSRRWAGVAI